MTPPKSGSAGLFRDAEAEACKLYSKDITARAVNDGKFYINGKDRDPITGNLYEVWSEETRKERIDEAILIYQKGIPYRTPALIALAVSVIALAVLLAAGPFIGAVAYTVVAIISSAAAVACIAALIATCYHANTFQRYKEGIGAQHAVRAQDYIDKHIADIEPTKREAFKNKVADKFQAHEAAKAILEIP